VGGSNFFFSNQIVGRLACALLLHGQTTHPKEHPMSQMTEAARGDIALTILRFVVLGTASALVGVLAHIAWRAISQ
jgi:hypothetical protein